MSTWRTSRYSNVYRDGSVSVFARTTVRLPSILHPISYSELRATADLGDRVITETELLVHLLEMYNGSSAIEVKTSTRSTSQQVVVSSISLLFYSEDYKGDTIVVNSTRLNTTVNVETLVYRFTGEVEIRAAGEPAAIIHSISMLKTLIQSQIQANPELAGVLVIKEFGYEVKDYAVVRFDVEYNYGLFLSRTMPEQEATFNITRNSITARYFEKIECDINTYLNTTKTSLEQVLSLLNLTTTPITSYVPGLPRIDNLEFIRQFLIKVVSLINNSIEELRSNHLQPYLC